MKTELLQTKLHAPKPVRRLVDRGRLLARLDQGRERKLTLVSAPAGFGKTTLLADWLATNPARSVAWLSLDQGDNSASSFWPHLAAALGSASPQLGAAIEPHLQSPQVGEAELIVLLNALAGLGGELTLVLDDFHLVDDKAVETGIGFLLERLPPNIHLVVCTRSDPALPLARLRAQGDLVEVRAADLRFTAGETAAYFNEAMGLELAPADVAALEQRTEGWIAALQLAALSMEGRDDKPGFVATFAGDDRYIVDYLVDEVLRRQSGEVRRFLRETCFLSRLSASLCDAVTGVGGSRAMLQTLERANLFLVPLDARREWYRYHHLFADVLLTHFADEGKDERPLLHRRASDWYQQHGEPDEAVRHALAARDFGRAAELIERAIPELSRRRQEATMRAWIEALPDGLIRSRPVLGVSLAGALASVGAFDDVEQRLAEAEAVLASGEPGVEDQDQLRILPAQIAMYRAAVAQVRGDLDATIAEAQRSVDLAPADDHFSRAAAAGFLGIAFWTRGELDVAHRWWTESAIGLQRAGRIADVVGVTRALADIDLTRGRLREVERAYVRALSLASAEARYAVRGTADIHAGLSTLHLQRNDLDAADRELEKSRELGELGGLLQHPYRWRVAAAGLSEARGDPEGAIALLDEAERLYVSDFFPNVRPIAATIARVRIAQGRLDAATAWQREGGVAVDDTLSYLREFEHITLARLLLAQGADGVDVLLDRLLDAADRGGRMGSVIEILVLQALALRARSDIAAALVLLERALTLAEPEGIARVFVETGEPMAGLLKAAVRRGMTPVFASRLLAALGSAGETTPAAADHPDLLEPLSERELDVLRLLRSDLDGPDIARELMVSLNTMRTHTKNIYEKLGVNNRRAAVRRAEDLNLLQRR